MQKVKNLMNFKVVAVIMAMIMVVSYFSISGTTTIVKVNGNQTSHAPFVQNGHTYVPLNEIAQEMGEKVTNYSKWKKVMIRKTDGKFISLRGNLARAIWDGRVVPLKTKEINHITVPVNAKAIYKDGQLYVPIEFISATKGMDYPVKVVKEGGKRVIYVGTIPAKPQPKPEEPKQEPTQPTAPEPTKPKPTAPEPTEPTEGKTYPDGWTAPVLKSSWTTSIKKNYAILQNELGFTDGGRVFGIYGQPQAMGVISQAPETGYEVGLRWTMWRSRILSESYRIPVVSMELFKFYFEEDATRVWNYLNTGDIPEQFTANGRTVKTSISPSSNVLYMKVGFPNKPF